MKELLALAAGSSCCCPTLLHTDSLIAAVRILALETAA